MNTVVVQFRDRARSNVTAPVVVWSLVMAVVLFVLLARIGSRDAMLWVGVAATAFLGAYLGWQRRVGTTFFAPLASWLAAWFPMIIGAMIGRGFIHGLFAGLFWITVGWLLIGFLEFVWLFLVASFVRMLRGTSEPKEPDVVIFGPDGSRE